MRSGWAGGKGGWRRKKDKRAKQERNLASGESAAVCRPVGMPTQPGTLSQGREEGGRGGPGVVGRALPDRLTGRSWVLAGRGSLRPAALSGLANKSQPSSGTQSEEVGGGWWRGGGGVQG